MSRQKRSIGQDTLLTPKPFTQAMLDDVDGGQEGLLPLSTQGKPLKIEFEPWNNTDPSPQEPESVELFWDGQPVDTKTWTAPIAPDDYYIDVPPSFLTNGRHEVHYLLIMYTGQTEPSDVRVLTVDIDPPRLNANSKLQFDTSVISIDYLIGTGDVAVATVPAYTTAAPGDVVIATWKNLAGGTSDELRTAPLTHLDYMNPIKLTFTGEFIRNMGDGEREVTYRVQDRAFNLSAESTAAQLLVAAIRPVRVTPYPWVVEIGGTPQNWGALDPLRAQGGPRCAYRQRRFTIRMIVSRCNLASQVQPLPLPCLSHGRPGMYSSPGNSCRLTSTKPFRCTTSFICRMVRARRPIA